MFDFVGHLTNRFRSEITLTGGWSARYYTPESFLLRHGSHQIEVWPEPQPDGSVIITDPSLSQKWMPPHDGEALSSEDRQVIMQRAVEAVKLRGRKARIGTRSEVAPFRLPFPVRVVCWLRRGPKWVHEYERKMNDPSD